MLRFLSGFRHIIDLIYRNDGYKGSWIGFAHIIHEMAVFLLVHNCDDLLTDSIVVCADAVVDGCAAVQLMQDILQDLIMLLGNDANTPFDVDTEDKIIHNKTAKIGTQHTEYNDLLVIA